MPILPLFTTAYLFSLVLFHTQAELPQAWAILHQHVGATFIVAFAWLLLGMGLCLHGGIARTNTSKLAWITLGALAAQLCTGIQAADHQTRQIPLACNKQIIESEFTLIEKAFRDEGSQTWLIEHTPADFNARLTEPIQCIQNKARLQMFVELANTHKHVQPGQQFRATLRVKAAKGPLQLEGFDVHQHWFANRIAGTALLKSDIQTLTAPTSLNPLVWMERVRLDIANNIVSSLEGHPEMALVLAMVVGDQGLISVEDREMFNTTGIAHLVAISGLHVTLFAMLAGKLLEWVWRRSATLCLRIPAPMAGSAFGLFFAVMYAMIAGWGVPAQRTVFMLFALFVGQLRSGMQSNWDTFFLALILTLAFDNWAVLDAGFVLSFGAVAVLIFVTQGHYCFIKPSSELLANAVKAQYTVTVGLILPCAILFNQQSLISPVANALSIPWMTFVSTPLALLGGLGKQPWALLLAGHSLAVQREWLSVFNTLSWSSLPIHSQPGWVYCLVALGCIILLLPAGLIRRWIGLILVALLALPAPRPAKNDFWMTLMDVGQGTAIAIQTRNHLLIYDAGPAFNDRSNSARRVLLPWMAVHGHREPNIFMLSHDDADHSGGAALLLQKAPPEQFVSSIANHHPLNQMALALQSETSHCHTMAKWVWDGVTFTPIGLKTPAGAHQKIWEKNNQSCVLKISNSQHSVLLTGDIEAITEMQLLAQHGRNALKADVLVVPHHGSKTSSTAQFLMAVQPKYALIQAGWDNQYGHPHKQVMERYESMSIQTFNTAQIGAMKWKFEQTTSNPEVDNTKERRKRYWHMHESGAKDL